MSNLSLDLKDTLFYITEEEIQDIKPQVLLAKDTLLSKTGPGNDFTGWIDLPNNYDKEEFERIKKAAEKINSESDVLLVIGIGGSYLGARAAIDFIQGSLYNEIPSKKTASIYYVGNCMSTDYTKQIMEIIKDKDFSINVISKSGTTTEPAIAFRIFKQLLIDKYGEKEANKRIYATTDKKRGALKTQADSLGYETFVVPDDIGGRYSVLTAVGLLPIAVSGINIDKLLSGALTGMEHCINDEYEQNNALKYAAARNILLRKGKSIEMLIGYEPSLHYISEWWKQLYGESEGKDKKGLFPASADFTTDLHSLGQFVQDGARIMFETVINVENSNESIKMTEENEDLDGLNYLAGRDLHYVNYNALKATVSAHKDGGVPNLILNLNKRNEETLGELFYFFEFACGISGYMLGVNPFNQPGVESYKKNMFALLGKPGY